MLPVMRTMEHAVIAMSNLCRPSSEDDVWPPIKVFTSSLDPYPRGNPFLVKDFIYLQG